MYIIYLSKKNYENLIFFETQALDNLFIYRDLQITMHCLQTFGLQLRNVYQDFAPKQLVRLAVGLITSKYSIGF